MQRQRYGVGRVSICGWVRLCVVSYDGDPGCRLGDLLLFVGEGDGGDERAGGCQGPGVAIGQPEVRWVARGDDGQDLVVCVPAGGEAWCPGWRLGD